jgi:hypothetical protein
MDEHSDPFSSLSPAEREQLQAVWEAGARGRTPARSPRDISASALSDHQLGRGDRITGLQGNRDLDALDEALALQTGLTKDEYKQRSWAAQPLSNYLYPPRFTGRLVRPEVTVLAAGLNRSLLGGICRPADSSWSCYLITCELRSTGRGLVGAALRCVSYWRALPNESFGSARRRISPPMGLLKSSRLGETLQAAASQEYAALVREGLARPLSGGLPGSGRAY